MIGSKLAQELAQIDGDRLKEAKKAFLSVPKSFTIRAGKVTGKDQFEVRLARAIAAYNAGSAL